MNSTSASFHDGKARPAFRVLAGLIGVGAAASCFLLAWASWDVDWWRGPGWIFTGIIQSFIFGFIAWKGRLAGTVKAKHS
jgi:hypothetical protein